MANIFGFAQRLAVFRTIGNHSRNRIAASHSLGSPIHHQRVCKFESTPIVVGDTIFVTEPAATVLALNAKTGKVIWKYQRPIPSNLPAGDGKVNRGLAILDNLLFFGSIDGYLVAINANTGNVVWQTQVASSSEGFSITGAPLVVNQSVVIGVSGGEFGVRGFLAAYDAMTGQQHGGSIPFLAPAKLAMRRGKTKRGKMAAVQRGLREAMIPPLIFFTGGSVTPRHHSPVMDALATTFSLTAWLRCMPLLGSLLGTSNLRPTTNMTGIQSNANTC